MSSIGERIKEIRLDSGLTQTEFGKKIGLKTASISALEIRKTKPSGSTRLMIVNEFCVNKDWLETGAGVKYDSYRRMRKRIAGSLDEEALDEMLKRVLCRHLKEAEEKMKLICKEAGEKLEAIYKEELDGMVSELFPGGGV